MCVCVCVGRGGGGPHPKRRISKRDQSGAAITHSVCPLAKQHRGRCRPICLCRLCVRRAHLHSAAQVVLDVSRGGAVGISRLDDAYAHALGRGGRQRGDQILEQHGGQAGNAVAIKQQGCGRDRVGEPVKQPGVASCRAASTPRWSPPQGAVCLHQAKLCAAGSQPATCAARLNSQPCPPHQSSRAAPQEPCLPSGPPP